MNTQLMSTLTSNPASLKTVTFFLNKLLVPTTKRILHAGESVHKGAAWNLGLDEEMRLLIAAGRRGSCPR